MKVLGEADIDERPLRGRRIAVIGYGNQGRAQALNLRDAGLDVRVGARAGGESERQARADGQRLASPRAAAAQADLVMLLVPDEEHAAVLEELGPALVPGDVLGFAHGFSVAFGRLPVPPSVGMILVAPCGPGVQVRAAFEGGSGVFAYVAARGGGAAAAAGGAAATDAAAAADASGVADDGPLLPLALAYARAIGCARAGVLVTTFRQESEVDLFGEQAVLCGGLHALLAAATDTMVEAGYPPEMAYLECVHQLVWLAATIQAEGVSGTRRRISTTALYGDLTRGPRVIGESSRRALRRILEEIRSGEFADEFLAAGRRGFPALREQLERLDQQPVEEIGRQLRARLHERREMPPAGFGG